MKPLLCSALLLVVFAASAEAPTGVPLTKEPHHHLVFENEYVRVFRVSVPGHDATLLHQHDVPYVYVSLGPADVINAVQAKPEAHLVMTDGQVGYSPGHFSHIARTDAGASFDNVTIELLKPQGQPQNLCEKIVDGPLGVCNQPPPSPPRAISQPGVPPEVLVTRPLLETSEMRVVSATLAAKATYREAAANFGMLFVVANDSVLQLDFAGEPSRYLKGGEVLWLRHGGTATITCPLDQETSHYWVFFFKDGENG
jgi:hypothetical protein